MIHNIRRYIDRYWVSCSK